MTNIPASNPTASQHWHAGHGAYGPDGDATWCRSTVMGAIGVIQYWLTTMIRDGHGGDEQQGAELWNTALNTLNRADFRQQVEESGDYSVSCLVGGRLVELWLRSVAGTPENCDYGWGAS